MPAVQQQRQGGPTPPKGYRNESTDYRPSEGFVVATEGMLVHGVLQGPPFTAGKGEAFQLELVEPCLQVKSAVNGAIVTMDKGSLVSVNLTVRLENIRQYYPGAKVWFVFRGKEKLPNGNEIWTVEGPFIDGKKRDDIPF